MKHGAIKRRRNAIIVMAFAMTLVALYALIDPASSRWVPKCVFHYLTGLDCPGCGSQRMVHDLLNADFRAAWHHNAFLLCISPLLALYFILELFPDRLQKLNRILYSPITIYSLCAGIIAWGVVRNIA